MNAPAAPTEAYDVLIVGAGIAGCAAAKALADADPSGRRRILVIDRHREVHPRFSGEFIHPRGAAVLEKLGFYGPLVEAGAMDADGFAVFEAADGRRVDLPYASLPGHRPTGLSVHHKVLVPVMRRMIRSLPQVDLIEGWAVEELLREDGRISGVRIKGPERTTATVAARTVIGADGKGSTVRKLAGIPDGREVIGFTAGVGVENAALPVPRSAHIFLGAWGPVLAYPILTNPDGTILTRITFDLPRELNFKGPALAQHLLDAYVPFLPAPLSRQVATAIRAQSQRLEMAATVNLPAPQATLPGLCLIGDAGGCSHPITASGMTMGLRDAELLGELARPRRGDDLWLDDATLKRYRVEHDRYVPTRQALADAIYEAFRGGGPGQRAIRRSLFAYWQRSETARIRSMALLSCVERRPAVFLSEYLRTAGLALHGCMRPQHATAFPVGDRLFQARGALDLASDKLGMVASVMWANVRPGWLPDRGTRAPSG